MSEIEELLSSYRRGARTPEGVLDECLHAIANSTSNSFINVNREHALAMARAVRAPSHPVEPRPLAGVPIAVKDLIDVAGFPTTMGAEHGDVEIVQNDAPAVALLRKSGAILLGKTNTHQFAYGATGDRSASGPVLNPHDPSRITGGSSSGSAAAVAEGSCYGALGTDTSGSIRLPAALCGVVGMKPTYDLISKNGVYPLSPSLDHVGPITKTVKDNALLLEVLAGRASGTYTASLEASLHGTRIGIISGFYDEYLDDQVRSAIAQAQRALVDAGAQIIQLQLPEIWEIYNAQQAVLKFEALSQHAAKINAGAPYDPEVRARLLAGAVVSANERRNALDKKPWAKNAFDNLFQSVDAMLTPTCGVPAPYQNERLTTISGHSVPTPWLLTRLTAPTNFTGHPSLSVPFGRARHLPIGMQVIGAHHAESKIYQIARVLEQSSLEEKA